MKKIFLCLALIVGISFTSCETDDITLEEIEALIDQKLEEYFGDLQALQQQITDLQQNQSDQQAILADIIESLDDIEDNLDSLAENQAEQQVLIETLTTLIQTIQSQIDQIEGNQDDISGQLEDILDQLEDFDGDIQDLEDLIEELLDLLEDCCTDCNSNPDEDEMTLRESENDPISYVIEVEDDENSEYEVIHVFEIDVDEGSSDLVFNQIQITITTGTANVEDVVDDFELQMNGNVFDDWDFLNSGNSTTATIIFDVEDEDFTIDSDEELEVTLYAEFNAASGVNYAPGETISAEISSDDVDAWEVVGSAGESLGATQLKGGSDGNTHTLLVDGAIVTFADEYSQIYTTVNQDDTAEFQIEMDIEAIDEPIYIPIANLDVFDWSLVNAATNTPIAVTSNFSSIISSPSGAEQVLGIDGNMYYRIDAEETITFTVVDRPGAGDFFMEIRGILFTSENVTQTGYTYDPVFLTLDTDVFRTDVETTLDGNNGDVEVETDSTSDVANSSATLRGEIHMNDFNNGLAFFVWGESLTEVQSVASEDRYSDIDENGADLQKQIVDNDLDGSEDYALSVDNLDDNETIYFRMCVEYEDENGNERIVVGAIRSFTTN